MEQKVKKIINEHRWFITFYIIWLFIHVILLMNGDGESNFWPFARKLRKVEIDDYGMVEFFVYTGIPIVILIIKKLVGDEIKEIINEE